MKLRTRWLLGLAWATARFTAIAVLPNHGVICGQSGPSLDFQKADEQTVRLPPSKFPQLPPIVRDELNRRGCRVPQLWEATKPGNVIRGSFIQAGQIDWAVLCSVHRVSSILIFRNSSPDHVLEIAPGADISVLQTVSGDNKIGYSRAISPVGRQFIMRHYQAYGGVKPPPIDHSGIDDAFIEKASIVHYFYRGKWIVLTGAD
jgi:hypothetical protein